MHWIWQLIFYFGRFGANSLGLFLLTVTLLVMAIVQWHRKNHIFAWGLMEALWMTAALRAYLNVPYCFPMCGRLDPCAQFYWLLGVALAEPLLDAAVLSFIFLLVCPIGKRKLIISGSSCRLGVVIAWCATALLFVCTLFVALEADMQERRANEETTTSGVEAKVP